VVFPIKISVPHISNILVFFSHILYEILEGRQKFIAFLIYFHNYIRKDNFMVPLRQYPCPQILLIVERILISLRMKIIPQQIINHFQSTFLIFKK
jgi:hypothetical protein